MTIADNFGIAVVIPCFNRKDVTLRCIRKLNTGSAAVKIFVSDSASSDGTPEAVADEPNVRVLHAGASAWWSEAINLGIQAALDENFSAILLMNDDIEFEQELVAELLEKNKLYTNSIISPLQHSPTGLFLGIRYNGLSNKMRVLSSAEIDSFVDTTNGCCLFVPRIVFESVGLIDDHHCPHLYGDTEFQLRAKRAGFITMACPSIKISQLGPTNYLARLKFSSLLSFKGSPLHLAAYLHFGKALFGGWLLFALMGGRYHYDYCKTIAKAFIHIVRHSLKK